MASPIGIAVAGAVGLAAITTLFGSWYTVDQGERAVVLRNGAFEKVSQPGLHFKLPLIESVVDIPVTQQVTYWTCPVDQQGRAAQRCGDAERPEMAAYSYDQQPAFMRVTVTWHVDPKDVEQVYAEYRNVAGIEARLIARQAPQDLKTIFGQYTAVSVIQDRGKFNADAFKAISEGIKGPVVIDSVQVENIDFSDEYEKTVEAAMKARVEVQKLEQQQKQQEVQAKITVINAQAAADAIRAKAKASADAAKLQGEGEAAAIRAKGEALKDNPGLVALIQAERWDGKLPSTMLPGSAVPFLSVNK